MQSHDHLASLLAKVNADLMRDSFIESGESPHIIVARSGVGRGGGKSGGRLPSGYPERLEGAVRDFRSSRVLVQFRILRLACYACCHRIEPGNYVLVADAPTLTRLIEHVLIYARGDLPRFRRLFNGLLRAYLDANRQEAWFSGSDAQKGSQTLRAFLSAQFHAIQILEPTPNWVLALTTYPEVLSIDPGNRFARDWLNGSGREFNDISARLGLTGSSWLASAILRSAVCAAVAMTDNEFDSHIMKLLAQARETRFESMRDAIYAALLTRYAAMRAPIVHPELRDALIEEWKNPLLARNQSAWRHVPEAARKMVVGWLKLDLIHQFFEVLAEDGRQDRSRFEFWRKHHESMDDVYFAMGSRAFRSRSPDLVKLRNALDGRLLELIGTGSDNNAFIMCMGDVAVVEFSKKGNAARRYLRGQLVLDSSKRAIGIDELRQDVSQRLIHNGTREETWQERFEAALFSGSRTRTAPSPTPELPTLHYIFEFAQGLSISIEDHRSRGGSLWLSTDDADPYINQQLLAWDFKYRTGRGWWRAS